MSAPPVFRFAPSPNGALHLGHAFSALLNARRARETGGRLLLRLEDIDTARCTPEFEQAILLDLDWLGVPFERPPRRQSEHFADYQAALDRLRAEGLAYPATLSRGAVRDHVAAFERRTKRPWPRDPDGAPLYPREADPGTGEGAVWRLDMAEALRRLGAAPTFRDAATGAPRPADPARWGDVVLARRDVPTSYHLSVVVDDALQGVTEVVRGEDLLAATAVHRVLQALLGLPSPAYRHHALILGPDGRKLSKSLGSAALAGRRERGESAEGVRRELGF